MNIYTEEEMIQIFKDIFDIEISKKEMQICKPDLIQKIYLYFFKEFRGSFEKLNLMSLNTSLMQLYPDMFSNTNFLLHLGKCIKCYLNLISEVDEFEICDIFQPDPSRTRKFLSILIDFYRHIRENYNSYEQIENEVEQKLDYYEELQKNTELYKEKIKKRDLENAENEMILEKSRKGIEEAKEQFEATQEMKACLKGRLEGLKQEIVELVTKIKETELNILEGNEKIATLQNQVIKNEEYEDIKAKENRLSSLKESNAEEKETLKDLKHNLQVLQKVISQINCTMIPAMEECEAILRKKEEKLLEKEEKEKYIKTLHEKIEELSWGEQMLQDKLALWQEQKFQTQMSWDLKKKGIEEDIKQLKLTFQEQQKKKEENEIVENDLKADYNKNVKEINARKEKVETYMRTLKVYLAELKTKVEQAAKQDVENISDHFKRNIQIMEEKRKTEA